MVKIVGFHGFHGWKVMVIFQNGHFQDDNGGLIWFNGIFHGDYRGSINQKTGMLVDYTLL